jgi:dienelactone hydrolase
VPALVLVALAGTAAAVVLPSLPAVRFLRRMAGPEPTREEMPPRTMVALSDPDAGVAGLPGSYSFRGPVDAAGLVVVHGLTDLGMDDPRLWRLAVALRDGGFGVEVPEVWPLRRLDLPSRYLGQAVDFIAQDARDSPAKRRGFVGISVGATFALRAAARVEAAAILLVGAPDDVTGLAREWFSRADAPAGADEVAALRAEAGRHARSALLQTALPRLVPDAERTAIRSWLVDAPAWRLPPFPADVSALGAAARRFVAAASAGERISEADRDWILAAIDDFLAALSPARIDSELDSLRCPVFLVHGVDDPLVPLEQMERLRARLARRVAVATLESRILSHVGVGATSLPETWSHVRFVQRFFDAVEK